METRLGANLPMIGFRRRYLAARAPVLEKTPLAFPFFRELP